MLERFRWGLISTDTCDKVKNILNVLISTVLEFRQNYDHTSDFSFVILETEIMVFSKQSI